MKELLALLKSKRIEGDIRKIIFNIVDVGGFFAGVFAVSVSIFIDLPKVQIVAIFASILIVVFAYYLANQRNQVNLAAFTIVSAISLVLFPVMFYTDGGLYGGMGYWYILGIIFNFLLIEGVLCYILLALQIALTLFCFIHTYYNPQLVLGLERRAMYVDVVQSILITAVISGIIVRFQNKVYRDKLEELSEMNKEQERLVKLAGEASRAKSDFLAQMSHEIRTPINAVLGMNEMILREAKNEDILEYAENIDSAGNTLLSLINSILDFSKIEDGKMDIVPVEYDTISLINNLYHTIVQRAEGKGLALILEVDETLPCGLIGDNVRVSQVIMNLLTNAVKYTEKGSITLLMHVEHRTEQNVAVRVAVKDTGIGIKEEDTGKLFESFERLEEIRNHNIEGTGLGISIVKKLLDMMGSQLHVQSTYGEGSVFWFTIEQQISDNTPIGDYRARIKTIDKPKETEDVIYAPNAKILLVDDNDMNLKVARNLLRLCGVKPDMVSSGREAIEVMRQHVYDIVFLDHMMPELDGIETLNRLKNEGMVPEQTAVIALTANAVVGAREIYLEAGFTDYLSKPIEVRQLVDRLKKYLPQEAYPKAVVEISTELEDSEILEFSPEDENSGNSSEARNVQTTDVKTRLTKLGIDVSIGLDYCGQDEEFYMELLSDYASSFEEKEKSINAFFESENWHEYEILVHGMKSNVKTLGATAAFRLAQALEKAAENGDINYIKDHHSRLLEDCRRIADAIKDMLEEAV
ncbi:MAG: response regulator [Acetatifactor sp.]|nr:response regulator [Acetatifactor sp.]